MLTAQLQKHIRTFIPADFTITTWPLLAIYFEQLQQAPLDTIQQVQSWLAQLSELNGAISEDVCWRQIKMTCDTTDKSLSEHYEYWCTHLQGPIAVASNKLHQKLMASDAVGKLPTQQYGIMLQGISNQLSLFTEANVPLQSQESLLAQQYGTLTGGLSITYNNVQYTLQQAAQFLQHTDRQVRKQVYELVGEVRLQQTDALNKLFDELLMIRHQISVNAGFAHYRDYKMKQLNRFDYGVAECEAFHDAVQQYIVPLCNKIFTHKAAQLGLAALQPFDIDATPIGQQPLKPFANGQELIAKSIEAFESIHPFFANCLRTMDSMQHLDLDSRLGKAPGGYNCPLAETGVPFIFMNAASTADDVITMMHEGGHAIHSFLCHQLPLNDFKEYPMEMAELASMSMELMSMDAWPVFYKDATQLTRAKCEQLERVITVLPWIAVIDKFQHWLYTNPGHTVQARTQEWQAILQAYKVPIIDYSQYTHYQAVQWQKQLHLFEVPFYYIEYGIAQLGAVAMWQQYRATPLQAIDNYIAALSKGNTLSLPQLYSTAGIEFNFSPKVIEQLATFLQQEMATIGMA
jgi:oligoendopeptidase F